MLHKIKISSREVQHKRARRLIFLFILPFLSVAIFSTNRAPVYAETACADANAINIDNYNNITYPSNVNQATAEYNQDTFTLTLENYNGGPICSESNLLILNIKGTNNINSHLSYGVKADEDSLVIEGDGELNVTMNNQHNYYSIFDINNSVVVNGATINTNVPYLSEAESCHAFSIGRGYFIMNSGTVSSACGVYSNFKGYNVFIMNDGTLSVSQILTQFFNQNGGTINILTTDESRFGNDYGCLTSVHGYVFNGGVTNVDCSSHSEPEAMMMINTDGIIEELSEGNIQYSSDDDLIVFSLEDINRVTDTNIPSEKTKVTSVYASPYSAMIVNDGDISIKGSITPILASFMCAKEDDDTCNESVIQNTPLDRFIKINNDLVTTPSNITLYNFMTQEDEEESVLSGLFVLTDGTDGAYVNLTERGVEVSDNVLKTLHIHKATVPIPDADGDEEESAVEDEENPNTIDYHLVSIISTILVSIIAEAFIIIDLRKRTKTLQSQIAEKSTTDSADLAKSTSKSEKSNS